MTADELPALPAADERGVIFADGACPPEVERAAQASFLLHSDSEGTWAEADEAERSDHRVLVVTVLAVWSAGSIQARALAGVRH